MGNDASSSTAEAARACSLPPLFTRGFWISLLLCAFAIGACIRSCFRSDDLLLFTSGGRIQLIGSAEGCVRLMLSRASFGHDTSWRVDLVSGRIERDEERSLWRLEPALDDVMEIIQGDAPYRLDLNMSTAAQRAEPDPTIHGFFGFGVALDSPPLRDSRFLAFSTPWPLWIALFAVRPLLTLKNARRRNRRIRRGLCGQCGYDLRGGHTNCPECGILVGCGRDA